MAPGAARGLQGAEPGPFPQSHGVCVSPRDPQECLTGASVRLSVGKMSRAIIVKI